MMRVALLVLLLAGCETPQPDLDSVGLLNPACLFLCVSEYDSNSTDAPNSSGSLTQSKAKTTDISRGAP